MIHPSAIIDPKAQLGVDVEVGPFCVIGPDVTIGDGCWLQNNVTICGTTHIGPDNKFYTGCSVGQKTQDLKYTGEPTHLEIGTGNTFREYCTLHRATAVGHATKIGSHGNFLAYSHIAHDCVVGNHVIFSNNATLAGHVTVDDHVIIGGLTAIHQFCRIGRHAMTGGCSKIVQDIPPFMIADGNPAAVRTVNVIGLERHGFGAEAVRHIKEAYRIFYRAKLNSSQALERLKAELGEHKEVAHLIHFFETSKRGITK